MEEKRLHLSELIEQLQKIKKSEGDLPVYVFDDGIEFIPGEVAIEGPKPLHMVVN